MGQRLNGSVIFKTPAEFNVTFLHGTPYGIILLNETRPKKKRLYFLDTKEDSYYAIAEWDEDDYDSSQKWREYALEQQDLLFVRRDELQKKHPGIRLDEMEQVVPIEKRMISDISQDTWSYICNGPKA